MNNAARFAKVMAALGVTFQADISDLMIETYAEALSGMAIEDIEAAARRHIQTSQFFPKPADLLQAIVGKAEDRARVAWTKVQRLRDRYGTWDTVIFDDPRIHFAIQAMAAGSI